MPNLPVCGHGLGKIGGEWLLLFMGCINSFRLILICFEMLRILVQSIDKYLFSISMEIHIMVFKIKKQNKFNFSSLVISTCQVCFTPTLGYQVIVQSPSYGCIYVFFFLFGFHVVLQNLQSN